MHECAPGYALVKSNPDDDAEYDEEEDTFLLHNLAEEGCVERLRALLPLPSDDVAPPRLSVLSSETSLLEKDDMGFLPLHIAVIHQQLDYALHVLRYSSALTSAMLHLKGGAFGTPFLHLVLRVGAINASFSEELLRELLTTRTESEGWYTYDVRTLLFEKVATRDEEGNSVFHLCARYDLVTCLDMLVEFYRRQMVLYDAGESTALTEEDEKKNTLMNVEMLLNKGNKVGFRPLHEAMKYRAARAARRLVDTYCVELNPLTSLNQTPAHIAAYADFAEGVAVLHESSRYVAAHFTLKDIYGCTAAQIAHRCAFSALESRLLAAEAENDVNNPVNYEEVVTPRDQTRFFFHPEVWRHLPMIYHRRGGPDPPPENFERIDTLVDPVFGILRSREFQRPQVRWDYEIKHADIADILRVHEFHYVDRVRRKCSTLAASVVGMKPVASRRRNLPGQPTFSPGSSCDESEECHATVSLDSDTVLSVHSYDAATRAAGAVCKAVDEVVAGNCRNAFCIVRPPGHHAGPVGKVVCENDPEGSLGFCLFNNVAVGAAYARAHFKHRGIHKIAILDFDVHHGNGTEEIVRQLVPSTKEITFETPYGVGKQVVHQYKPWRSIDDSENVFFCSVHGYGPKEPENKEDLAQGGAQSWFYPGSGVSNVKMTPFIWDEGLPICREGASASRLKWRSAFRDRILPKLREFNPDLIFLSAGFDAHKKEHVNWGYVSLLEQDYEWLVCHIKRVANTCCDGRLISVLEGGYNFHGRMVSPFARSVAAHTRALINPAQECWDDEAIANEAAHEQALLATYMAPGALNSAVTMLQSKKRRSEGTDGMTLSCSRSKRARKVVDYVALSKELGQQ
ncbi:hypothetical protein PsorP6_017387 [Peronosclerospora sorghi]|uniref:Uncharacterized protein n=1 Tax=Peronosclerospora sorghi TaxID=230839 RepID=A0ACC0WPW4_9STRA|nr:hypothetical protein PsorP6_017387 [Peronosclerospora sorghi]